MKVKTLLCGMSVVQDLVIRVDIGVVTYEAMTLSVESQWFLSWFSDWMYRVVYVRL